MDLTFLNSNVRFILYYMLFLSDFKNEINIVL